jgi:hypothetical protein
MKKKFRTGYDIKPKGGLFGLFCGCLPAAFVGNPASRSSQEFLCGKKVDQNA